MYCHLANGYSSTAWRFYMNKLSSDANWSAVAAKLKQQSVYLTHDDVAVEEGKEVKMSVKVQKRLEKIRKRISLLFAKI
jgi:hypothetical protein